MTGVVGGAVGKGTFTGEILSYDPGPVVTNIHGIYHFHGRRHSLSADNYVVVNNATGRAVINGTVMAGG